VAAPEIACQRVGLPQVAGAIFFYVAFTGAGASVPVASEMPRAASAAKIAFFIARSPS
jgi:hypothetical protein